MSHWFGACVLADVLKKWPGEKIRMPDGFVSICGFLSMQATLYPSMMMSSFDAMCPPSTFATAMAATYPPQEAGKRSTCEVEYRADRS